MKTLKISKSEPMPLHVQLTEQLRYHIEAGTWKPGAKLPTVRELAAALRINYNTVRAAFQELEHQGYLATEHGRGTFVFPKPPRLPETDRENLHDIIDEAMVKAQGCGITAEEFARAAYFRAKYFSPEAGTVRLLFAECNQPDLDSYTREIERGTGVHPEAHLLDELAERRAGFFRPYDLLATPLTHVVELQQIVGPERNVLGLMITPSYLEVLTEIAQLPQGTRVGLVCTSRENAERMSRALIGVGATHLQFMNAGVDEKDGLAKVFQTADLVYVSRIGMQAHQGEWPGPEKLREYVDGFDATALRLLRQQIAAVRARAEA